MLLEESLIFYLSF